MQLRSQLLANATIALCAFSTLAFAQTAEVGQVRAPKMKAYSWVKPGPHPDAVQAMKSMAGSAPAKTLPVWSYFKESTRDGNGYSGVMVGRDPFNGGGSVSILTYIVPLIIETNTIGTSVSGKGIIATKPGLTVFNPAVPDKACLSAPNNVPLSLFQQSPIFKPATYSFGGTDVGTTQYTDAFQRANFWEVDDHDNYHVTLGPIKTLGPILIKVPAKYGVSFPTALTGTCGDEGIVDINWFDAYLDNTVLPALAAAGINPSNFPIFEVHNVVWANAPTDLNQCCIIGYHGYTGFPIQTYSPVNFDSNAGFFASPEIRDSYVPSHEVAEWMNDPYDNNPTPAWGHIGQVGGCQGNLEVGDPLTGTPSIPIAGNNGFTYHLEEAAFFSWFFGGDSVGIHEWFSNNASFLQDAGPVCQ